MEADLRLLRQLGGGGRRRRGEISTINFGETARDERGRLSWSVLSCGWILNVATLFSPEGISLKTRPCMRVSVVVALNLRAPSQETLARRRRRRRRRRIGGQFDQSSSVGKLKKTRNLDGLQPLASGRIQVESSRSSSLDSHESVPRAASETAAA